jgi:hypothetical protein
LKFLGEEDRLFDWYLSPSEQDGGCLALQPLTDRGSEILDAMEAETTSPFRWSMETGARSYWINGHGVPDGGFEPVLERIAPDWRAHLRVGRRTRS